MGFFDDLKEKAKMTTDKTNKMTREMRLKSYINENKNKIDRVYTVIGRKVYEKHEEGKMSEIEEYIKPEIEEIEEIARKIENMNNEIRVINNIKLCQNCYAEIKLDSLFCPKCGAKQEEKNTAEGNNSIETVVNSEPVHPGEVAKDVVKEVAKDVVKNDVTEVSTEETAELQPEQQVIEHSEPQVIEHAEDNIQVTDEPMEEVNTEVVPEQTDEDINNSDNNNNEDSNA